MNSSAIHEKIFNFQKRISRHFDRIFILPTRFGTYFIIIIFVLFLMSLSYGHSLAITGTFLFVSVVVVSAYYTNFNLSGLGCGEDQNNIFFFEGESFFYQLDNAWAKPRVDLAVELSLINKRTLQEIRLVGHDSLAALAKKRVKLQGDLSRGVYQVNRIKVSTDFPFGLFRSWMYLRPQREDLGVYIYPTIKVPHISLGMDVDVIDEGGEGEGGGVLEFYEHTAYHEGEETKRIDWKIYSRTHELYLKHYHDHSHREYLLERRFYSRMPIEAQLSFLCYKILEFSRQGIRYALVLNGENPKWGQGQKFERECLNRLSEF